MPEMRLRQHRFTYSACGTFTKNKERIQKFKHTGGSRYIYKNQLDKACVQPDMALGVFKDFKKRAAADEFLRDKAFNIAKNPKYDGYQRGLASMLYRFFDRKTKGSDIKNEIKQNQQLAEELHKPIIKKFKKRRVYSAFKNNIWAADMQLISRFNKGFRFLFCVFDTLSKYAWVVSLKDKKGVSINNAFQKILKESARKPHKIWLDKGSEFYNSHFKKWLKFPSSKKKKEEKSTPEKLLTCQGMELSSSKIKKFFIFQEMDLSSSNISQKKPFLIFREIELSYISGSSFLLLLLLLLLSLLLLLFLLLLVYFKLIKK